MEGMNITIKKNDIITLEITDITAEGSGVGHENGMAVFVPSAAKGDIISCRIVKVLKNLCYGIVEEIITPSPTGRTEGAMSRKPAAAAFSATYHMSRSWISKTTS